MIKTLVKNIPSVYIVKRLILAIIFSIFNINYINILANLTETVLNGDSKEIIHLAILYIIYLGIWESIEYLTDNVIIAGETKIENALGKYLLHKIYNLKPSIIKKYNTGYINGVISNYVNQKLTALTWVFIILPVSSIYIIYCVYKMSTFNIKYGLALLIVFCTAIMYRILHETKIRNITETLTKHTSNRNKYFIDIVSNIGTAQKMEGIEYLSTLYDEVGKDCLKSGKTFAKANAIVNAVYKLIIYLYLPIVCIIYYTNANSVDNPVQLFSFLSIIAVQFVYISRDISTTILEYVKYKAKYNKLAEILNEDNIRCPILNDIEFRSAELIDVEYKYYNSENQITTTVKIPKFKVNRGDKICIYGESGQGKSTTLNILSGEIESDNILINGQHVNQRLDCCYIAQDNFMFDLSLRDNLTLGKNISDEEIISLINKCGLKDWFNNQSKGLDTILGERGVFVSTGQRQRLNLIRGLLVKYKEIYLLDEPTSNVDDDTEELMINAIIEYLKDKTVIIVTHRPNIKKICNKFYKFENSICYEDI